MSYADILSSIDRAFPVFSSGERHIDEAISKFPFDQEGIRLRWDWYDRLSKNVLEFLNQRFPGLGQRDRSIICRLQMSRIREKITWIEWGYDHYRSIEARHTSESDGEHLGLSIPRDKSVIRA